MGQKLKGLGNRRPLTGAWIETGQTTNAPGDQTGSPPHRGVDRNGSPAAMIGAVPASPPHRGVDRNNPQGRPCGRAEKVAPSQGRGSKLVHCGEFAQHGESPPHRGVDRNVLGGGSRPIRPGRPLTGAWIETLLFRAMSDEISVAPSQGRGSKPRILRRRRRPLRVAPSQGRGSKPERERPMGNSQ